MRNENGDSIFATEVHPCDILADGMGEHIKMRDEQVGGDHYTRLGPHQPLDIVRYVYGNRGYEIALFNLTLKYVLRAKGDRLEDLRKAKDCLERMIELHEEKDRENVSNR